jgi:hypothetical protein
MIPLWAPIVLIVAAVVGALLSDYHARRSLRTWATAEGVELLDAHRAPPWQAPFMYLRGSRLVSWRVTIRRRHDRTTRSGVVTFMFERLRWFRPVFVEARWDAGPTDR